MRHDPASAALVVMLRGLKMHGMAQAVGELVEQGAPAFEAAVPTLSQLLKAEMAEREVRSIAYQTKTARFPAYKDLTSFDFAASEANEATVRQLHRGEFTDRADNVVLIGGPGTGKTHLATALGMQAIEHGRKKVRFFSTVDLVNAIRPSGGPTSPGCRTPRKRPAFVRKRSAFVRAACDIANALLKAHLTTGRLDF